MGYEPRSSALSSGGVRNGSSGGCCTTTGTDAFVEAERIDGAMALGARNSVESAGSVFPLPGTCRLRDGDSARELGRPYSAAASAFRCRFRKLPAVSIEGLSGVAGRERSGFITLSVVGPCDSRKP